MANYKTIEELGNVEVSDYIYDSNVLSGFKTTQDIGERKGVNTVLYAFQYMGVWNYKLSFIEDEPNSVILSNNMPFLSELKTAKAKRERIYDLIKEHQENLKKQHDTTCSY